MAIFSIIICLAGERFLSIFENFRRFKWFRHLERRVKQKSQTVGYLNGIIGVLLLVFAVAILIDILYSLLSMWSGLFGFIFATFILFYCLGPKALYEPVKRYYDAIKTGDESSADWYAENLLGEKLPPEESNPSKTVAEGVFVAALDRIFAVIFWFVLFGPFGAVMYRLTSQLKHHPQTPSEEGETIATKFDHSAILFHHLLAWLPSRLLAFAFAFVGNISEGIKRIKINTQASNGYWQNSNDSYIVSAASDTLIAKQRETGSETGNPITTNNALALLRKSTLIWLGIIAIMSIW